VVCEAVELGGRMRELTSTGEPPADGANGSAIIGRSPAMLEVYKAIGRVADKNVTVLVTGESGTGKELVARAVYQHSARAQAPFLAINCAAIPESLLESEMFGHEKGAFTGADRRRIGKFEQLNGGTILLDEIGDMPLTTQGKILRLLQDQRFERVGGNITIQTDVRLIAATNRELKTWADAGNFRLDLYYRLNVFSIHLPPLRERGEDLLPLVHFYISRFREELRHQVRDVASEAMRRLSSYGWPGNIRELQSVLKQALLRARGNVLMPEFLPEFSSTVAASPVASAPAASTSFERFIREHLSAGTNNLYAEAQLELDRTLLTIVLQFTHGNQIHAARILGIARQTLRNRLREVGVTITKSVEPTDGDVN
jgi:two-component system nitrogen regulation response regulator GlnG